MERRMSMTVDAAYKNGDLCRVTCEGARVVQVEHKTDTERISSDGYHLTTVPVMRTELITVMNPARVWVESIDPERVRERIAGPFPNPDAALLQDRLDKATEEIAQLRARIARMDAGYERSKELWKKRHREDSWLDIGSPESIGDHIDRRPEPDPYW
jgi:hypothetical protein